MMKYYLGIDIGSSSSKAVIIDENDHVCGMHIVNIGTGSRGPHVAIEEALKSTGIAEREISRKVATGYGRMIFPGVDKQMTEIICHARGAVHMVPGARTVIDIGGQDAKVVCISESGLVGNFVMNDKCAAGTGRFLEVMARVLDVKIGQLSALATRGTPGVNISSTCTVFAESEMISQLSAGSPIEDIALGALRSIAEKIAGLAGRVELIDEIVMTGGVALNEGVRKAVGDELGRTILRVEMPQAVGALGAALFAKDLDKVSEVSGG